MASQSIIFLLLCITLFSLHPIITISTSNLPHSQATLSIFFRYPDSNLQQSDSIYIRGDNLGLDWNTGLRLLHVYKDTWLCTLDYTVSKSAGLTLQFKALVNDKVWSIGANFQAVIEEDSTWVEAYPWFYTTNGKYQVLPQELFSERLNNSRSIVVYTPPSYYENTLKPMNNVLLMHDGQNLFNASTSFMGVAWQCQDTIDQLVNEGTIEEVMIIGVYNTPNRMNEYTYSYWRTCFCPLGEGGLGDTYLDFLEEKVIPFAKKQYRIETGSNNLGMMGSSLGGLISCYAGYTRSHVWGKVGCMSSSFSWNSQDFNNTILNSQIPQDPVEIYLDSGTNAPNNDDMEDTITVRNHLESLGFEIGKDLFYYLDIGGQHNEYYWGKRFHIPISELYPVKPLSPGV